MHLVGLVQFGKQVLVLVKVQLVFQPVKLYLEVTMPLLLVLVLHGITVSSYWFLALFYSVIHIRVEN